MGIAVASVLFAAAAIPVAAAESVPRDVSTDGPAVSVSYRHKITSGLRETGLGPRVATACSWTTRLLVERVVRDAAGAPIPALVRVVAEEKFGSGRQIGHCTALREPIGGVASERALQTRVEAIAREDAAALRTELASLASLGVGAGQLR